MADSNLNITVTSEDAALQALVQKLNTSSMSVKELNTTFRDLRSSAIAGSQSLKDLNDIQAQVAAQSKSLSQQQNSLVGIIKQERQERRLGMFAVMESLHAVDGLTGKNKELSSAVIEGTQTVFGISFALQAMEGIFAEVAMPVAIVVGLFVALKALLGDNTKALKELNDAQLTGIDIEIELGEATNKQKEALLQSMIAREQAALAEMQTLTKWQLILLSITGGKFGATSPKDIQDQINLVNRLRDTLRITQDTEDKVVAKQVANQNELIERKYAAHQIDGAAYEQALKNELVLAKSADDWDSIYAIQQKIDEFQRSKAAILAAAKPGGHLETGGLQDVSSPDITYNGKNIAVAQMGINRMNNYSPVEIPAMPGYGQNQDNTTEQLKSGLTNVTSTFVQSVGRLITSTGTLTDVFRNVGQSILEQLMQIAEQKAANALLSLFGLPLPFAASGGTFGPGSTVLVGDDNGRMNRTSELMQVGRSGVRIFSNQNSNRIMNNATSAGGGSGMANFSDAINGLASMLVPASPSEVNLLMIKQNRIRNGRILK